MVSRKQYDTAKDKLLKDPSICTENRKLYREFFTFQEHKLKRMNGLPDLDSNTLTTLYQYIVQLRNVNTWFKNKPLRKITKKDIQRVYDGLEEGSIQKQKGGRYKDRVSYYNKIFKSTLFRLAGGKDELAKQVIVYTSKIDNEVRYLTEEDFRKLLAFVNKPDHLLLMWLAFDIGENITALLQLKKSDFTRELDSNKDPEYRVRLRNETLKRSRRPRSEITNYPETVTLLDAYLKPLGEEEELFKYQYRNAVKFFNRIIKHSGVVCRPNKEIPSWKDLRSSMACDLLRKGWSRDEVNARLGHAPSSSEIDKYINFFALDRHVTKKKFKETQLGKLQDEIAELRENERQLGRKLEKREKAISKILEALLADALGNEEGAEKLMSEARSLLPSEE